MPYKILNKAGDWLVQVQRKGMRSTRRGSGGEAAARKAESQLILQIEQRLRRREAAELLGLDPEAAEDPETGSMTPPTLAEFLKTRWASHARLVQNETTRRTTATHVRYMAYFLGGLRLDRITVADVNRMTEELNNNGPISFKLRKDGKPRQRRSGSFAPAAINRILGTLKAALHLAEAEGVIPSAPSVKLLPRDESRPVVPPTETEFEAILEASKNFVEAGPHFPEVIQLAAETGLRESELFNLCWRSVDFSLGDTGGIRVEEQQRTRVVNGKPWKPKHLKFRVVPLTEKVREILQSLWNRVPHDPDDPVIPNRGGCPYVRIEHAPDRAGKGWWPDVLQACGLRGKVTFHSLRHMFAVRCLQRGVPIAVVSAWLGHSDVNLTVKRYGRWSTEAREQWDWIKKLSKPIDSLAKGPWLTVHEGGAEAES